MQTIKVAFGDTKWLFYEAENNVCVNDFVVVETSRGEELLKVLKTNVKEDCELSGKVIRVGTSEDIKNNTKNILKANEMLPIIKEKVKKYNLDMKVVKVEYTLNQDKLIIQYVADERIDFRDLVKDLASSLKSRIEMHQIGSRDQVKIIGALGCCGRVCCCKAHLEDFEKVSIKMAKNQNLSLNPQKLNGMCGKLMCCLKYEDDMYAEILKRMPKVSSKVHTPDGDGVVKSLDVLKEQVEVMFTRGDETERKIYDLSQLNFSTVNKKDV